MTPSELKNLTDVCCPFDVRDQLKRHIYERSARAFAAGDAARDGVRTVAQLRRRQAGVRRFLVRCLGGWPAGARSLRARTVGVVKADGFTIEKVIFESRPRRSVF